jgi:hypothetical protein
VPCMDFLKYHVEVYVLTEAQETSHVDGVMPGGENPSGITPAMDPWGSIHSVCFLSSWVFLRKSKPLLVLAVLSAIAKRARSSGMNNHLISSLRGDAD